MWFNTRASSSPPLVPPSTANALFFLVLFFLGGCLALLSSRVGPFVNTSPLRAAVRSCDQEECRGVHKAMSGGRDAGEREVILPECTLFRLFLVNLVYLGVLLPPCDPSRICTLCCVLSLSILVHLWVYSLAPCVPFLCKYTHVMYVCPFSRSIVFLFFVSCFFPCSCSCIFCLSFSGAILLSLPEVEFNIVSYYS